ncbi:MAG: phosphatase PAP2 family protein [Cytophagaceae bacterium]|nr:phosphatase PAP2 family protein [Cytophagaceae bacterium]
MNRLTAIIDEWQKTTIAKLLAAEYPRFYQFISNRLFTKKFNGLPFTFLTIVFVANLLLFNEIAESIENAEWMLAIDNSFAKYLFNNRNTMLANSFFYFSKFGSYQFIIPFALVVISLFIFQKRFIYVISLMIALAGTGLTSLLSKIYFHRVRPVDFSFYNESSYSFPSGHAMYAVAFYGLLFYIIILHTKKYQLLWAIASIAFIFLIGFSRLYLVVHFLSDVLQDIHLDFVVAIIN